MLKLFRTKKILNGYVVCSVFYFDNEYIAPVMKTPLS